MYKILKVAGFEPALLGKRPSALTTNSYTLVTTFLHTIRSCLIMILSDCLWIAKIYFSFLSVD